MSQADVLAQAAGMPGVNAMLLVSGAGCVAQGTIIGSCLQLVYMYLHQEKRDSRTARAGVLFITMVNLVLVVLSNVQNCRLLMHYGAYEQIFFLDYWMSRFHGLLAIISFCPVFLFFTRQAYIIWERRKRVLAVCVLVTIVAFVSGMVYVAYGLRVPAWGLGEATMELFEENLDEFVRDYWAAQPIMITCCICNAAAAAQICILTCLGIHRYRNGFAELDGAIRKVVFVCCESMMPMVLGDLVFCFGASVKGPSGILILRFMVMVAPPLYLQALLMSLVARERVANILAAEPVRYLPDLEVQATGTEEKTSSGGILAPGIPRSILTRIRPHAQSTPSLDSADLAISLTPTSQSSYVVSDAPLSAAFGQPSPRRSGAYERAARERESACSGLGVEAGQRRGSDVLELRDVLERGPLGKLSL